MKTYASSAELFESARRLASQMSSEGNEAAAKEILRGIQAVNGLTDGWALFLESLDRVNEAQGESISNGASNELQSIRAAVRKAVYR